MARDSIIVRRVLGKLSPGYAQHRINVLMDGWIADVGKRPDVYRAAIEDAKPEHRPHLEALLPLMIDYAEPEKRAAADLRIAELVPSFPTGGEWLAVWLELYFKDGSARNIEYLTCCETLERAGRQDRNGHP